MSARALAVVSGSTERFSPAAPTEMPKLGQDNTAGSSEGWPAPSPKCRRLDSRESPGAAEKRAQVEADLPQGLRLRTRETLGQAMSNTEILPACRALGDSNLLVICRCT